jgi:tetratricopeptide (TPR) repeat protein
MQYAWMYVAGTIDATSGLPSSLEFAAELERVPKYRSGAWHMRRSYYRMLGSFEKARGCQREMELLELRDGPQTFKSANFRIELASSALCDDVVGLKSLAIAVDAAAQRLPRLRVMAQLSRAHFHRLRGEYAQALECLSPVLEFAEPGGSLDWFATAASHVDLLVLNGRVEDALACAERYRNASDPDDRSGTEVEAAWALALAAAGRVEEAESVCDGVIQLETRRGTRGLRLARLFQVRARIALARGDHDAFTVWANQFADFCSSTESSALRSQANRLLQEGRAAGVGDLREIELPATRMEVSDNLGTIATRLSSCGDRTERARLALSLALETFGADSGHLFGVQGNGMERLVSFPHPDLPDGLAADVEALVARERAEQDETQYLEIAHDQPNQLEEKPKTGAYHLRPLYADSDGGLALVGAIALSEERAGEGTKRSAGGGASSPAQTLRTIADALAENGDVDRISCAG